VFVYNSGLFFCRDHLNIKYFYCMQKLFYHWKNVTEQSLEALSATFIAKFHVSVLSTSRNTAVRDSPSTNGLLSSLSMLAVTSLQYQNSLLSPRVNSFIRSPVKSSTPLVSLHSVKRSYNNNDFHDAVVNSPSRDDVKRQLFVEDKPCASSSSSSCSNLSPPCKCLNTEVLNQLSNLQQDLDSNISKSVLCHHDSNLSVSLNSSATELSENVISPPVEFSEQSYAVSHSLSISSVGTKSLHELKPVIVDNPASEPSVTHDCSFVLYNKMVYIIKMMQLYPASVAFIAWRKFVLKMKSLRVTQNEVQHLSCQNSVRYVFDIWKSQTCRSLEYKQLEMSFLAKQRKRTLCGSLLKWTSLHLKHTRISYTLDDYLSCKNNDIVKHYFTKWKCYLEINLRIRNHIVSTVKPKYYTITICFLGSCITVKVSTVMEKLLFI